MIKETTPLKKKIYIAGKVTGEDQQQCIDKFQKAAQLVEVMGYEAVNPLEVVGDWQTSWQDAMKKCLKALIDCDGIMMLEDWQFSKGAKIEFELALNIGLTVLSGTQQREFIRDPKRARYGIGNI